MPIAQINLRIPASLKDKLDDTVWRLRWRSRNEFIKVLIELFVDFEPLKLALFITRHFPDEVDSLIAEIIKLEERRLDA